MGRRPKLPPKVLEQILGLATMAGARASKQEVELRYPSVEEVMEECATTPEQRRCFEEWKKTYPSDTRRRHLSDWGVLPTSGSSGVGRGVVRIVIPPALQEHLTSGRRMFCIGRVMSTEKGRDRLDGRFAENYVVRIMPAESQDKLALAILPFRHLQKLESGEL